MNENIESMRQVAKDIVKGYDSYSKKHGDQTLELYPDEGKAFIFGMQNKGSVSICDNWAKEGTRWNEHYHEEWEYIIVYEGKMTVYLEDVEFHLDSKYGENRTCYIFKNTPHSMVAHEDTSFYAISVPESPDFPAEPN